MNNLISLKCKSCGAPLPSVGVGRKFSCGSCGSNYYLNSESTAFCDEDGTEFPFTEDDLEFLERAQHVLNLINQIEFLEFEYESTKHPSIPGKIALLREQLSQIKDE